jgi:hypothetical protein
MEEKQLQQFYFYQSYADAISQLTNTEAGRFITLVLSYMFRDKEISDLPDDKVTGLFFLLFDDISLSKTDTQTITRKSKHFAFHSTYANIFFALSEIEAGILIKQICAYMFDITPPSDTDCKKTQGYFNIIKRQLDRSKRQSLNGKKPKTKHIQQLITMDKIRTDFQNISGYLRPDAHSLEGVSLDKLYDFIKDNPAVQTMNIYTVIQKFREKNLS